MFAGACAPAERGGRPRFVADEGAASRFLKVHYFCPVRDWLNVPRSVGNLLGRHPLARNVGVDGSVADSAFYTNRDIAGMSPAEVSRGPCSRPAPRPPFQVSKVKTSGGFVGFFGKDADGRRFIFKLDLAGFPELGSGASIVCSRILWALGYHVPADYLVTVTGTGDDRFDGRRALASEFVAGKVVGGFKFDWVRDRREFRGLRLACAWLNHTDCVDTNTLVAIRDGRAVCYLIDFNSALGSWQGVAKQSWRGWRFVWDIEWQILGLLTLGRAGPGYDANQPVVSPAVGRFDARFDAATWRQQTPNTAFENMDAEDARWMCEQMARLSRGQLVAAIEAGGFSRREDRNYLLRTLFARRAAILGRYAPE